MTKGNTGSAKRKWYHFLDRDSPLNQPVIILLATVVLQFVGWRWTVRQTDYAIASSSLDRMVAAVGKRLTANSIIVGAHEAQVEDPQLSEAIDQYHALQREWDLGEDLLDHHLRLSFPDSHMQLSWGKLKNQLDELDKDVGHLSNSFKAGDSSRAHYDQIKLCRKKIVAAEKQLAALTRVMSTRFMGSNSVESNPADSTRVSTQVSDNSDL